MRTKPKLKVYYDVDSQYTDDPLVRVEELLAWIKKRIEENELREDYLSAWDDGYLQALADLRAALDNND